MGEWGWDLCTALRLLRQRASQPSAQPQLPPATGGTGPAPLLPETAAAAAMLLERVVEGAEALAAASAGGSNGSGGIKRCPAEQRRLFRVHPKGEGVVLLRSGGLPADAFVGEYLGEVFSAWRRAEREHAATAARITAGSGGQGPAGQLPLYTGEHGVWRVAPLVPLARRFGTGLLHTSPGPDASALEPSQQASAAWCWSVPPLLLGATICCL